MFVIDQRIFSALRLPADLNLVGIRRSAVPDPLVSIVVPVRNRRHTVGRSLASALALKDEGPTEVIVIDDFSGDGTRNLLEVLADPRISAVALPKRHGANTARNVGIAIARAPVIAFLDSDDEYMAQRLSEPLRILAKHPEVGVVISSFVACKDQVERYLHLHEKIYESQDFLRLIAGYILPPSTSGLTIRRELLLACGGFNPKVRRMQDRDLLLRLAPMTKAATSAPICWRKNWGSDGISSSRTTYYEALCEFVELHPIYAAEKLAIRNYLIARHLIALSKRGMVARAIEIYRHARTSLSPGVPPWPVLLSDYLAAKRRRRQRALGVLSRDTAPPDRERPASRLHAIAGYLLLLPIDNLDVLLSLTSC